MENLQISYLIHLKTFLNVVLLVAIFTIQKMDICETETKTVWAIVCL